MEELPTFSSPQKATTQVNGTADEESANAATYTADDSMDIDQSIHTRNKLIAANEPQASHLNQLTSFEIHGNLQD